jgi:RNA polymerase sigma-70 factor (ECF subfamily)
VRELGDFAPTRRSLLTRLKNWDDQEGWQEFFDTYAKLIYGLARKCGLSDAESQDVVQETCIAVVRRMPGFRYDPAVGSFKGWLFKITRRRIVDQFRKRLPRERHDLPDSSGQAESPDCVPPEAESTWEREWQQNLLTTALARLKGRVSAKQYQMFDLYVTQAQPMASIIELLGVNRAQVYMAKMRLSRLLRREIEALTAKAL